MANGPGGRQVPSVPRVSQRDVEWQWTLLPVGILDIVGALGLHAREGEPAKVWGSIGLYHVPELDHQFAIQRLTRVDPLDIQQRPEPIPVVQHESVAGLGATRLLVSN
jgi:hypothetical protein